MNFENFNGLSHHFFVSMKKKIWEEFGFDNLPSLRAVRGLKNDQEA